MMLPFASAYYFPSLRFASENAIQSIIDFFEPFLRALFGGQYSWGPDLLFERLLLFVLLVGVIYLSLGRIPIFSDEHKRIRFLVAFLVPLIGVRFLDYAWLVSIITSYQVLAIALTAIFPFIIYFFFLYNAAGDYPGVRKIGWILFIIVYFGLWTTTTVSSHSSIYFWTMLTALIFLFFDGTIYGYYAKQKMKAAGNLAKWEHLYKIRQDIDSIKEAMRLQQIPDDMGKKLLKKKEKLYDWVMKNTT